MLGKNIAGINQGENGVAPSDAQLLMAAYNSSDGGVQAAPPLTIPVTQVQTNYPTGGGSVDGAPSGSNATANVAVVSADGVNSPTSPAAGAAAVPLGAKVTPLVIAGLGLGALLLFGGKGKSVGAKKKSMLLPVLVAGGLAWWFFFKGKGGTAPADAQMKTDLQTLYATQPKQLAVINAADAETIRRWWDVSQMWGKNMSSDEIYATGLDGSSYPVARTASLGAWWEQFAKDNGL